jgi:hypothetical protein
MGAGHAGRGRANKTIPTSRDEAGKENHRRGDRPRPIRQGGLGWLALRRSPDAVELHPIGGDWLADVLDLLHAHRLEAKRELLLDFVRHLAGNADSARIRNLLKPRSNVDALAVPVCPLGSGRAGSRWGP